MFVGRFLLAVSSQKRFYDHLLFPQLVDNAVLSSDYLHSQRKEGEVEVLGVEVLGIFEAHPRGFEEVTRLGSSVFEEEGLEDVVFLVDAFEGESYELYAETEVG